METGKTIRLNFTKKRNNTIKVEFVFDTKQALNELLKKVEAKVLTEIKKIKKHESFGSFILCV